MKAASTFGWTSEPCRDEAGFLGFWFLTKDNKWKCDQPLVPMSSKGAVSSCCADQDAVQWNCVKELQKSCYFVGCGFQLGEVHCINNFCQCEKVAHCAIDGKCVLPSEKQLLQQRVNFSLVKQGAQCGCTRHKVGVFDDAGTCAIAVNNAGGKFFIYGTNRHSFWQRRKCYIEVTDSRDCVEGWESEHAFDFFEILNPPSNTSGIKIA